MCLKTRHALDALLKEVWALPSGRCLALDLLAIDEGYWQSDVRNWVYRHPWSRVITVRARR